MTTLQWRTIGAGVLALGLLLVFFDVGLKLFGWAVLCVCLGALFAFAALLVFVGVVLALIVCVFAFSATRAHAFDPALVGAWGFGAEVWLGAAWVQLCEGTFHRLVHFTMTPEIVTGLVLIGLCAMGEVALRVTAARRPLRATPRWG